MPPLLTYLIESGLLTSPTVCKAIIDFEKQTKLRLWLQHHQKVHSGQQGQQQTTDTKAVADQGELDFLVRDTH